MALVNLTDLEYLSILVGGHVAVELGEVEKLVLHGLAGLLVVLGVVPDEGPVLVKVPHEVVVIIELAQGHHGVSAGQQGAGRTVALGNKFYNIGILKENYVFSFHPKKYGLPYDK